MIAAGIDAGSRTIKVVLLDADSHEMVGAGVADQGVEQESLALELLERALDERRLDRSEVGAVVATGYGRKLIRVAEAAVTEITCQAQGIRHLLPDARTIVDIGGQDSKVIRLGPEGTVADFAMNDRCAAGTGRFLEVVATQLGVRLHALGALAATSRRPAVISSTCVVFAETEIVGLLATGIAPEDIAAGIQWAIASRVAAMSGRGAAAPIVFTGGVALVAGMEKSLSSAFGSPVVVASEPQLTAALGAALLAAGRLAESDSRTPRARL